MNFGKLSSTLAVLLLEDEIAGGKDIASACPSRPQTLLKNANGKLETTVFVYCDENADFAHLPDAKFFTGDGKIRTARIKLEDIGALTDAAAVHYLSASMRLKSFDDLKAVKTSLQNFKAAHPELLGGDIIFGIIGAGVNVADAAVAGRVLRIWDQTRAGNASGAVKYGKLLTGAALAGSSDADGLGTETAKTVVEVFPAEAKFIAVKTDFQTARIADGIRYIFDEAKKAGKPAVVVLNFDGRLGTPDQTDDLSAFTELLKGDKRFVVSASKNNAGSKNHLTATFAPNNNFTQKFRFNAPSKSDPLRPPQIVLRGWFEASGKCEIYIRTPLGFTANSKQKTFPSGNPTRYRSYGNNEAFLSEPLESNFKLKREFMIDVRGALPDLIIPGGAWEITVKNVGSAAVNISLFSWVPEKNKDIELNFV